MAWCISAKYRWCAISEQEVEDRDGVKQGDQVILNPSVELAEGSKVQVGAIDDNS